MTQTQEPGQGKVFLHILTRVNTRSKAENIYIAIFVGPVVKHNRNELQYGKSAKTDDFISGNSPKTLI